MQAPYLRFPSLHGDTVSFVCDDDLWQVDTTGETAGGTARRLTAGLSEPATPCVSPDGRWLAFIGRDEQHPEVYLMAAVGGPARRLTWLGPDTLVRGWTPEGHILFVSTHGQPFFRNHHAFTLDPAGGSPRLLLLGQVNHLAYGPPTAAGQPMVIGRNTADPARWKRYRGGTAGHLWIDVEGSGTFRCMTELASNITSPMWLGGRIYHLSDRDGVANLYSCQPDGGDLRTHTDHAGFYAQHAQTDGQRIVYQCGADLWLFDPASNASRRLDINTPSHQTQAARRFISAADYLGGMRVHPKGHSVALDVHGQLFDFALWEGAVRRHGQPAATGDSTALPPPPPPPPATPNRCRANACGSANGLPTAPRWSRWATPPARNAFACSTPMAARPATCRGISAGSPTCARHRSAPGWRSPTTATRSGSATWPAAN